MDLKRSYKKFSKEASKRRNTKKEKKKKESIKDGSNKIIQLSANFTGFIKIEDKISDINLKCP